MGSPTEKGRQAFMAKKKNFGLRLSVLQKRNWKA